MSFAETVHHEPAADWGDPSAFAVLFAGVCPTLAVCPTLRTDGTLGRLVEAADLVREIGWRALESFSRLDPERGKFRHWIFGVAFLPSDQKKLLVRHGFEGLTLRDLAAKMEVGQNVVKLRGRRLRRRLEEHPVFRKFLVDE